MELSNGFVKRPIRNLVTGFLCWKSLLLLLAFASPGPGYDTSAGLDPSRGNTLFASRVEKLTRWDAIYYVKAAARGYQYEQEWAFGWGFTRLIALCTLGLKKGGLHRYDDLEGLVGVLIAHVAHLLSVLTLYYLSVAVFSRKSQMLAYLAASLHVISPAGLFLSTPCAESSCALLSFAGILVFCKSFTTNGLARNGYLLLSGLFFGIATTFRSNGILNGLLLLEEAIRLALGVSKGVNPARILRLLSTGAAGMLVGVGFVLPQYIAHMEYCGHNPIARPWCDKTLPSIYVYVQDHYWNNGLFRYWTISNLPLFILGAPMFAILFISSRWALITSEDEEVATKEVSNDSVDGSVEHVSMKGSSASAGISKAVSKQILRNLAVQQFLLALLTLMRAHVQIISRISSAYPVWMWYCAGLLQVRNTKYVRAWIRFMVIYAIVQAGLYASFLPPA